MRISTVPIWVVPLAAALWITGAPAADPPPARPADDALTCEQIHAQGMVEAERDRQERARRNDELRNQGRATMAMVGGAMMAGGLGGTGQAAQKAVEAQTDRQMAVASAPQSNARMERLKQLWSQKRCVAK